MSRNLGGGVSSDSGVALTNNVFYQNTGTDGTTAMDVNSVVGAAAINGLEGCRATRRRPEIRLRQRVSLGDRDVDSLACI